MYAENQRTGIKTTKIKRVCRMRKFVRSEDWISQTYNCPSRSFSFCFCRIERIGYASHVSKTQPNFGYYPSVYEHAFLFGSFLYWSFPISSYLSQPELHVFAQTIPLTTHPSSFLLLLPQPYPLRHQKVSNFPS